MNVRLSVLSLLLVTATGLLNAAAEPLTIFGAVKAGDCAAVKQFIEQDKDAVNRPENAGGLTPLHWAAILSKGAIVRLLLEHGAAVDRTDNFNQTPLHFVKYIDQCPWPFHVAEYKAIAQLLQQWPQILRQRANNAKLALCCAWHQKLGANSPINILPPELKREILQHLQPRDFASIDQPAPHRCIQVTNIAIATACIATFGTWLWAHR